MFDQLANWMKSTVLGVIILGTCGSLLALLLLKIAKKLSLLATVIFSRILPEQAARITEWYKKIIGEVGCSYGFRLGRFLSWNPSWGVSFYFAYHLLCTVCFLIISSVLVTIVFIVICGSKSGTLLTTGTYILTVLAFLFAFWAVRHFLFVFLPYRYFPVVRSITKDTLEKIDKETRVHEQEGEEGSNDVVRQSDTHDSGKAADGLTRTPDS